MLKCGSVPYEQFTNWRAVGLGRFDIRSSKRPFSETVVRSRLINRLLALLLFEPFDRILPWPL
jgi:hypothetical protein